MALKMFVWGSLHRVCACVRACVRVCIVLQSSFASILFSNQASKSLRHMF